MSDKDTKENAEAAVDTSADSAAAAPLAEAEAQPDREAGEEDDFTFAEDPVFELDYKGDCAYEVKVSIPPANDKQQAEEMFEELKAEAEVPGFRRGKAPRKLIENKFRKAVRGDVTQKLVSAAFRKLIKDEALRPVGMPDIDGIEEALDRAEDAPLDITYKFEVAPRCELGKYRGIAVERPIVKIDDQDIDEALADILNRFATYENLENGTAQEGDQVVIDFAGTIGGEPFDGGAAENYPYILGSKRFFAEFEAVLKGAKSGQELKCDVTFPEDYSAAHLAGKTAQFTIKVNEVKRQQMPEINDEFAKQAGYDSVAAMREQTAEGLRGRSSAYSDQLAEDNAMGTIIEASTFELPKSLIQSSAEEYYQQEVRRLMELRMPRSEIETRDAEIRADAEATAIRNIKGFVVISEIGEAEGIEVTDADFEEEAEAIRQRTGMEMEVISRYLEGTEQRDEYESRIFRRKAMAVVLEHAVVSEKEVTRDEMEESDDHEEAEA